MARFGAFSSSPFPLVGAACSPYIKFRLNGMDSCLTGLLFSFYILLSLLLPTLQFQHPPYKKNGGDGGGDNDENLKAGTVAAKTNKPKHKVAK